MMNTLDLTNVSFVELTQNESLMVDGGGLIGALCVGGLAVATALTAIAMAPAAATVGTAVLVGYYVATVVAPLAGGAYASYAAYKS